MSACETGRFGWVLHQTEAGLEHGRKMVNMEESNGAAC